MNAYQANLLNGIVLIAMSLWGYMGSATPSKTALIPAAFGAIFLICTPMIKKHNKVVAHVVVLLTLLVILALFMPLKGAVGRGDTMAIVRIVAMIATSILAMIAFIKSFRDARKAREAENA